MLPYSIIANYYDKFTQNDCDYTRWSQYLYDIACRSGVREAADLACGTGKMTALLVQKGLQVVGVDASAEMLNVARDKCRATFVLQDMRRLVLPHATDMAVCVNDGVNYLKPAELAPFFRRVAAFLKEGAPFVFDISSQYKLTQKVGDNVFYLDGERETLLWSNKLRIDRVEMKLTLFELQSGYYIRSDERHVQYIHPREAVEQALADGGFELVELTSDYGKPLSADSLRQTFYAIKTK